MKQSQKTNASSSGTPDSNVNTMSKADAVLLSLFYLTMAVYLPVAWRFPMGEQAAKALALVAVLISMTAQVRMVGAFAGALGYVVTLLGVAILTGSPLLAATLGALVTTVCAFARLCLTRRSPLLAGLPILAYGISFALLRSPFTAALSLLTLPCALVVVITFKKERDRIGMICSISLALGGTALVALLIALFRLNGTLNADILRDLIETVRSGAISALVASVDTVSAQLGLEVGSSDSISTLVNLLFNYLPALLIILCNLVALVIHTAMMRIALGRGLAKETATKMLSFDMSMISAIVYFLALILSLTLADTETAFYGTVAQNVYLILVPGMLMTAWIAINTLLFGKAPSCLSFLLYIFIIYLIFNFPSVMLPVTASFGAAVVMVGRIRRYFAEKNS